MHLDFGILDLLSKFCSLGEGVLIVLHGEKIFLDLSQVFLQVLLLLDFTILQVGHQLDFLVMSGFVLLVTPFLRSLHDFVLLVGILRIFAIASERAHFTVKGRRLLDVFIDHGFKLILIALHLLRRLILLLLELLGLLLDNLGLSVQNELLSFDLERLFAQLVELPVKVSPHLRVLCLEQADVLMTALVIVVETADARLLLVLQHFLFQNFELKFHKVNLLLQVHDVLVLAVALVRINAELARGLLALLLPAEIHCDSRLVSSIVAEGATTSEIGTAFQIAASYS